MQQDAALARELPNRLDWLNGPDLVVREHDAHENRLVGERLLDGFGGDDAVFVGGNVRHLEALFFEALARVEHGLVLDGRRDDVLALRPVVLGDTLDREVVAFGGTRGEHDLFARLGTDEARNRLACGVDRGAGARAEARSDAGRKASQRFIPFDGPRRNY